MAALLPGVRAVVAHDFDELLSHNPETAKEAASLRHDINLWARPLLAANYDRVINLTFTRNSGVLAACLDVPDTRGVVTPRHGSSVVRNAWLTYFVDLLHYRRFNRFNLADLYALGGSGPGTHVPIRLAIPSQAETWAGQYLSRTVNGGRVIAVHVGASKAIKAWRPEYFGRAMAAISRRCDTGFVLTGSGDDRAGVHRAITSYRASGGAGPVHDATGHTDVTQLAALLASCRLLLTNDTGPMHVAVGVGTPVIDVSVGHVDCRESGPYGTGHWVVQSDLPCSPCGFDQVCPHHACKDEIVPEQVAALGLYLLGSGPFPAPWTGGRLYQSCLDADGLVDYRQRGGSPDPVRDWYRIFWRRFWYDTFTGRVSCVSHHDAPAPDLAEHQALFRRLEPIVDLLIRRADDIASFARQQPIPPARLQATQEALNDDRQRMIGLAMPSPAFAPITVALMRDLHNSEAGEETGVTGHQAKAYRMWRQREHMVMERLHGGSPDIQAPFQTTTDLVAHE